MYRDCNVIGRVYDVYLEPPKGNWSGATVLIVEDRSTQYAAKVACQFSGAARDKLAALGVAVGDVVHVRGEPESREHGGRWFTTFRALLVGVKQKVAPGWGTAEPAAPPPAPAEPASADNDLPF